MIPAQSEIKMTVSQIEQGIIQKNRLLDDKNQEYVNLVEKRAINERDWRVACYRVLLELSSDPVTVRQDLVKGDKDVSRLKMQYEISLGIERACLESMKDLREKIAVYRSFLSYHKAQNFMQGS